MIIKNIVEEDFCNYKSPSMFIIFPFCTFKCDKENGTQLCQNLDLTKQPNIEVDPDNLIKKYISNPITKAIVCGGLEPMDSFDDLRWFIHKLREEYNCFDPVIIYTGYNPVEIITQLNCLQKYDNIIVKFGRFRPNQKPHFDELLGINLVNDEQYAERIS